MAVHGIKRKDTSYMRKILVSLLLLFLASSVHADLASTWDSCKCRWENWKAWSDCSSLCFGERRRSRSVKHKNVPECDGFEHCATNDEGWDFDDCNNVCQNSGEPSGNSNQPCDCQTGYYGDCCQNLVDCGDPGSIENGDINVIGTTYGKTVSYTCNQHYNLTDGDELQTCQDNSAWSGSKPSCVFVNTCGSNPCQNEGTCIDGLNMYTCLCGPGWSGVNCENDIQPPAVSGCPGDIRINATERTAFVNWTAPGFSDPLGNTVDITKNYPTPEFMFPWGDFTVQYVATKTNNGLSAECSFQIRVRPTPCEDLNIPVNGARICNGWRTDYGRVCIVACQESFTLPATDSYERMYICGASGNWIFPAPMPDCSISVETRDDALVYQPEHASYSFATCTNETDSASLKQRYISTLKASEEFSSYCTKYPDECIIDKVDISCF